MILLNGNWVALGLVLSLFWGQIVIFQHLHNMQVSASGHVMTFVFIHMHLLSPVTKRIRYKTAHQRIQTYAQCHGAMVLNDHKESEITSLSGQILALYYMHACSSVNVDSQGAKLNLQPWLRLWRLGIWRSCSKKIDTWRPLLSFSSIISSQNIINTFAC